jgi:hypothetical protein
MDTKLMLSMVLALAASGCDYETAEAVTEGTVERTVEVGRGIGAGITKGARQGREGTESADGAQVVSTWDQLEGRGTIEVTAVRQEGAETIVTVRFGNDTDQPIRVSRLNVAGAILAMDAEQVAYPDRASPDDFTVHPNSRRPIDVRFAIAREQVRTVRIWGHDLSLPAAE